MMDHPEYDERGKIFTKVINKVPVDVIIQTTAQLIYGKIHVKPDERLSDEINYDLEFLPVTNAIVYSLEGKIMYEANFISINRAQIVWVLPNTELLEPQQK
jgi:hypothetical protein